jgi:hypothetical protein
MSYVAIHDSHSDGQWHATADQYEAIMHAWESGAPRISFTTEDGADVTVRADAVHAVAFLSDAAIAAIADRRKQSDLTND